MSHVKTSIRGLSFPAPSDDAVSHYRGRRFQWPPRPVAPGLLENPTPWARIPYLSLSARSRAGQCVVPSAEWVCPGYAHGGFVSSLVRGSPAHRLLHRSRFLRRSARRYFQEYRSRWQGDRSGFLQNLRRVPRWRAGLTWMDRLNILRWFQHAINSLHRMQFVPARYPVEGWQKYRGQLLQWRRLPGPGGLFPGTTDPIRC